LRRFFRSHRRRFWLLSSFFLLFLIFSTAAVVRLQMWFNGKQAAALTASTQDLHTLASGSLLLSGLHPEEILREETTVRTDAHWKWNEYFTEILVGGSFPLESWMRGLAASLEHAGARLVAERDSGETRLEVRYHPQGWANEIVVERILVRERPSPEDIVPVSSAERPRASLVIDDLGQDPAHFSSLVAIGIPFTVSILPKLPYSHRTALQAADLGMEILLHLPMEPFDFPEKHPGPGALFTDMTEEQILRRLGENLDTVPGVVGVNNHMGSRLTADLRVMEILMGEFKSRGLFFLDSKTSPRSLAFDTASRFGIPATQRDIFLDAYDEREFVRGQIIRLIELAKKHGRAIGIGHPYANTLAVLEEMKAEILESGVEWVPLSRMVIRDSGEGARKVSSLRAGEEGD